MGRAVAAWGRGIPHCAMVFFLQLTPQRDGNRSAALHLTPILGNEGVLPRDVAQRGLTLGNSVADDKMAVAPVILGSHGAIGRISALGAAAGAVISGGSPSDSMRRPDVTPFARWGSRGYSSTPGIHATA